MARGSVLRRALALLAALITLAVATACKRQPLDDEARVAAIVERHPMGSNRPDDITLTVRAFVKLRHDLRPFVDATAKHVRVDCDVHAHRRFCARGGSADFSGEGAIECRTMEFLQDGAVADLYVVCADSPDGWARVAPFVLDALDGVGSTTDRGVEYRYRDEALLAKARADALRDLGPLTPAEVPPELSEPYDTLTSTISGIAVDFAAGDPPTPGRGATAAQALATAGRLDLLRNAARGLNREGRVLAAAALVAHAQPLSPEDIALVQKIRASTDPVDAFVGCSPMPREPAGLLADPSVSRSATTGRPASSAAPALGR